MQPQLHCVWYCLSNSFAFGFKTDRSRTPLFHVAHYGDDIADRELNLRKPTGRQWESTPQPSERRRPMTIKTSASTEAAIVAYIRCDLCERLTDRQTEKHRNGQAPGYRRILQICLKTPRRRITDVNKQPQTNVFELFYESEVVMRSEMLGIAYIPKDAVPDGWSNISERTLCQFTEAVWVQSATTLKRSAFLLFQWRSSIEQSGVWCTVEPASWRSCCAL